MQRVAWIQSLEDPIRDHRRADLLGPVVSRSGANHEPAGRPDSVSIPPRSAGIPTRRTSGAAPRSTPGGPRSARTRSPTASTSRRQTGSATRTRPGTDGITFFGHSFICDPFGRYIAEAGEEPGVLLADCDPALIETVRRNWPFLRDRRIDAYDPILQRYLGHVTRPRLRMPAEWEPHRATWLSWPHHEPDWPGKLGPIPWVYAEIARVLAAHEPVEILCARTTSANPLSASSQPMPSVRIVSVSTSSRPIEDGSAIRRRPGS